MTTHLPQTRYFIQLNSSINETQSIASPLIQLLKILSEACECHTTQKENVFDLSHQLKRENQKKIDTDDDFRVSESLPYSNSSSQSLSSSIKAQRFHLRRQHQLLNHFQYFLPNRPLRAFTLYVRSYQPKLKSNWSLMAQRELIDGIEQNEDWGIVRLVATQLSTTALVREVDVKCIKIENIEDVDAHVEQMHNYVFSHDYLKQGFVFYYLGSGSVVIEIQLYKLYSLTIANDLSTAHPHPLLRNIWCVEFNSISTEDQLKLTQDVMFEFSQSLKSLLNVTAQLPIDSDQNTRGIQILI